MAREYPTASSNPWSDYQSPRSKLNTSAFSKVLSSPHAVSLLSDDFYQQVDKTYKLSRSYRFVSLCKKIDALLAELFALKERYVQLQAMKDLYKLISIEKLNEYLNSLEVLTNLFSHLSNQKDLINSIISIQTDDSDLYLKPSTHKPLQDLLIDIKKSVSIVNSLQSDLAQLQTLSRERSILVDLKELTSYIDECLENFSTTHTKITNLTRLV